MEIRPSESPIYGGVPIEMEFSAPFTTIPYAFYLVFKGSKARHVSKAQLVHCSNDGRYLLLATAPPHDRIEPTDLHAYYRLEPSSAPVLFHSTKFQFMSDAAYQVASTLIRTQLSNTSSLVLERVIKDRLELKTHSHCLKRVDRRLTAAFRAIQKPDKWTIAPSMAGANNKKDTSETLLHLSSRMGLSDLCEYLLTCPGSLLALKTCNSQGSLPQDLARQNGHEKLAERLSEYRSTTRFTSENLPLYDRVISERRDYSLPPTVTTNLTAKDHTGVEVDMDRLEDLMGGEHAIPSPFVVRTRTHERNLDVKIEEDSVTLKMLTEDSCTVSSLVEEKRDPRMHTEKGDNSAEDSDNLGAHQDQVLRRPSFCRLSSSCPSIPNHLVHPPNSATASGSNVDTAAHRGPQTSTTQEDPRLMVNSKISSVSSSALDAVARRASPAEDDEDAINVKILVNDITPASSQEFLQASNPSSRRSSASDVRHSPSGNSIGGNTAQRLAKKHLQQSPESQRRQSWSDLTKAGVVPSSASSGISSSGSPKGKRSHRSPIKLQRSVSLNSLETAGECGGPEIAEKSDVHTSSTDQQGVSGKQQSAGGNAAKPPSGASQQLPPQRGVPTQLPLSGEHNHSMQPPPSPRTHRSASSGEAMLLLNRREDLQTGTSSVLSGATGASVPPKLAKPLPPGVQSKKDHSLQKSISTPSIVVAQETLIQHSQSDSRVEEHPPLVHQLSAGNHSQLRVGGPHKNLLLHNQRSKVHLLEEEDEFDDSPPVHDYVASVYRSQSATGRPVAASGLLNSNATSASAADSDDEKFIGKRTKKRGSLFFRRKKSMLINKSASQLAGKDRSTANLASALKSSASSLSSKDRKQGTSSRSNLQNAPLQNDTTGGSSKESSPSSAAKGTTDELDSPYGLHGEMSDYYAQNLTMQEVNSASMESLDSGASVEELAEIDDPYLRLLDDEPQQWSATVDKKIIKKLKERDVKRQEAIYELILTEKHHYLTLRIMEKLYYDGMSSELQLAPEVVNRMFPRLGELLAFHGDFLRLLRTRQSQANPDNQTIDCVADILIQMFQGENATKMLTAYGAFCSKHKDAVAVYKEVLKADKKFTIYVAKRSRLALCKGRGIPECILLVTQRLTKYPLLIDALIKSSKDHPDEVERLKTAQILIKDVINGVNAQVAEAERDARLLEIYHKIDAKSTAYLKSHKFKKSDLLSSNRKLRHEGTISLRNARGKQIDVTAVLLSDVIFFLQENNQKYIFAAFDNKPSVISLHKLLVRERAGQDARALYLISSNAELPEMFEFICGSPKEKGVWLEAIRKAIETCPAETDDSQEKDAEEVARSDRLRRLQISLHEGDRQIAQICQEKLAILSEMLETIGVDQETIDKLNPRDFKYTDLLQKLSPEETNQMLLTAASQVHQIFAQIPIPQMFSTANATDGNSRKDSTDGAHQSLGRSVSSAGEHQSILCADSSVGSTNTAAVAAVLPKRAETFGGFDANAMKGGAPSGLPPYLTAIKKKLFLIGAESAAAKERTKKDTSREFPECHLQVKDKSLQRRSVTGLDNPSPSDSTQDAPPAPLPLHQLEGLTATPLFFTNDPREQLEIISDLTHNLSIIMCLYCQSASSMESLRLQTTEMTEQLQCRNPRKQSYRPDLQLEELRNLQEQLTQERTEWQKKCQLERQQLDRQREEIEKLQEQIRREQEDIEQQRDWLFRRLEKLDKTREMVQLPISSSPVSQQASPLHSTQHSQQANQQTTHTSSPSSAENSPRGSLQGRAVSSVDLMAPAMLSVMPFDMRSSQSTTSLMPFHLSGLGGPQSGPVSPNASSTNSGSTGGSRIRRGSPPAPQFKEKETHSSNSLPAALTGLSQFLPGHHHHHNQHHTHHSKQQPPQPQQQQQQQQLHQLKDQLPQNSPPKQVLPLHLAKRGPPQRSHSASSQAAPSPVHVRAGSSPAKVHYTQPPIPAHNHLQQQQQQQQHQQHQHQHQQQAILLAGGVHCTALNPCSPNSMLIRANTVDDSTALNARRDLEEEKEIFC